MQGLRHRFTLPLPLFTRISTGIQPGNRVDLAGQLRSMGAAAHQCGRGRTASRLAQLTLVVPHLVTQLVPETAAGD